MEGPFTLNRRHAVTALLGAAAVFVRPAFAAVSFSPPLWVVRRGTSKVYLFGEMFADRDFGPSPEVVSAFNESAEYWKETPPLNQQERALFTESGRADTPLTERLGVGDAKRLLSAAAALNVPTQAFEPYRPWLAVQRLQGHVYRSLGVAVQQDAGVSAAAKAGNQSIRYEFSDGQALVRFFTAMSPEVEREYLLSLLATFEAGIAAWARRPQAWAVGDLSVEEEVLQRQSKEFPAYFSYMTARNKAWVPRIHTMLDSNTASFVRVGFDHLLGPDSIPHFLEQVGLKAERLA